MKLSNLQKYILIQSFERKGKLFPKPELKKFYRSQKQQPKKKDISGIITKSVERLIDKELMIGYGIRTPHKWFIKEIKLTPKGKKTAKKIRGEQQALPLPR
ncbi:MAG: hypothetical protein COY66_05350 [Candidatus Kerfeldbacteria bacterium CG_4_10_14_0_8_um_filter_42_10]|uniref:Uncharacterized protein n=1 Tax=Candidatus Kerfeldbacteria bacterium CG_4_10_14_0_8_um_filter_42_10 TaxID=2014248 RepID=A0A2M7RHH1_9BACT|nr:MAG: hypothetical protein COY66_05350 [Candidatus Kerfeldbacteria bacterium CG_4_10_14_0_8_um_filter_42_10]